MKHRSRSTDGRSRKLASGLVVILVLLAPAAFAQNALYTGTLAIGFGDPANGPGGSGEDLANNGVPACANANPFLPATIATVPFFGYATQGAGTPASLMFPGYSPVDFASQSGGGQQPITSGTCVVQFPPFIIPNLRSRVQFGNQVWPGDKLNGAATAFDPLAPGGTLSAGGGFAAATAFSPAGFYATGMSGMQTITPGVPGFGGGVPVNGGGGVQLGVNFPPFTNNGDPLATFGIRNYAEGFLPTGPAAYGTSADVGPDPIGARVSNEYTWRARTPGPISGPMGTPPLPLTANLGFAQGNPLLLGGVPVTTMGDFRGIFQKWTTGMVQHTDMSGQFTTIRAAAGFDTMGLTPITAPNGTTRRLQLVTPWSAAIQKRGDGPFAAIIGGLPDFGFGGIAVLSLDITPAPEPGMLSMLGAGAIGLLGVSAIRRRSR